MVSTLIPAYRRRLVLLLVLVLAALFLVSQRDARTQPAQASDGSPIYMTCTGARQGVIKGSVTKKGLENYLAVSSATDGLTIPIDAASGLPTGRRQHKPLVITKEIDKATAPLLTALVTDETLKSCTLRMYQLTVNGTSKEYFHIVLTNAHLISRAGGYRQTGNDTETLSMTYQRITCTDVAGGVTATDDWETPVT
jgi:type VI secretion system secreted protein Hcp